MRRIDKDGNGTFEKSEDTAAWRRYQKLDANRDKDTTIPVKHASYMKQKADSAQAPVEIMLIKNAGHNWRVTSLD